MPQPRFRARPQTRRWTRISRAGWVPGAPGRQGEAPKRQSDTRRPHEHDGPGRSGHHGGKTHRSMPPDLECRRGRGPRGEGGAKDQKHRASAEQVEWNAVRDDDPVIVARETAPAATGGMHRSGVARGSKVASEPARCAGTRPAYGREGPWSSGPSTTVRCTRGRPGRGDGTWCSLTNEWGELAGALHSRPSRSGSERATAARPGLAWQAVA